MADPMDPERLALIDLLNELISDRDHWEAEASRCPVGDVDVESSGVTSVHVIGWMLVNGWSRAGGVWRRWEDRIAWSSDDKISDAINELAPIHQMAPHDLLKEMAAMEVSP